MGVVLAAAMVVALWWIPAQTSVDATARTQPAVLPLVCAGTMIVLALAMLIAGLRKPGSVNSADPTSDAVQRLTPRAPHASHAPHWRRLCANTLIVALGIAALSWWGPLAVPVAVIPPMMLYLGERRPHRIVLTVAVIAAPLGWLA